MKVKGLAWVVIGLTVAGLAIPQISSAYDDRGFERREGWWQRWRDVRSDRRDLEGTWYLNGDRDRPAEIVSSRRGLQARNEHGQNTRLEIDRRGDVRALDWEGGLRGDVRGDRIDWENGTTWTRSASRGRDRWSHYRFQ